MYTFPCLSFKKLPLFVDAEKDQLFPNLHRYEAMIDVSQLPLDFPDTTHAQEVQLATSDDFFKALEGGLLISADDVQYDENTRLVTLSFNNDSTLQGVIPFEQTYEIIKKYITDSGLTNNIYVGLAIMTGISSRFW